MNEADYSPSGLARITGAILIFRQQVPSPTALSRARVSVARTIGQILSGIGDRAVETLLEVNGLIAESGPALVLGTSRRTSVLDAAFVNGVASRAADHNSVDDQLYRRLAPVVALLLSIGEDRAVSGELFLRAYLAGVEAASAISPTDSRDLQRAASLVIPAVAAASHILELNASQLSVAIELASQLTAEKDPHFAGTEFDPIGSGYLVRTVLFAALIAESGAAEASSSLDKETIATQVGSPAPDLAGLNGFERAARALPLTSFDELWVEFANIASRCIARDQVAPLFELLDNIDKVSDIRKLARLLEAKARPDAARSITFAKAGDHDAPETTWVP